MDNNNVTYKISCMDCNASYMRQKRKLKTKLNKHVKNIRLDPQKHSVISDRISNTIIRWIEKMLKF